jgi:isoleucyl-tRNA synthetase
MVTVVRRYTRELTFENLYQEMQAYHLYTVVPRLLKFMDDLTNWYVKMNRNRLKGAKGAADADLSIRVLFQVLMTCIVGVLYCRSLLLA